MLILAPVAPQLVLVCECRIPELAILVPGSAPERVCGAPSVQLVALTTTLPVVTTSKVNHGNSKYKSCDPALSF